MCGPIKREQIRPLGAVFNLLPADGHGSRSAVFVLSPVLFFALPSSVLSSLPVVHSCAVLRVPFSPHVVPSPVLSSVCVSVLFPVLSSVMVSVPPPSCPRWNPVRRSVSLLGYP